MPLTMSKTLFQKIIDGEIPGKIEYQDDLCFVLQDISPQAPTHLLIIPKKPLPRLSVIEESDKALLGHLLFIAQQQAAEKNLQKGYRVVINNGPHGGETIPHLHVHLLGGRGMMWPPG